MEILNIDDLPSALEAYGRTMRKIVRVPIGIAAVFALISCGSSGDAATGVAAAEATATSTTEETTTTTSTTTTAPPTTTIDPIIEANEAGYVALCNDGNYSTNMDFRATCSGGDGIDR